MKKDCSYPSYDLICRASNGDEKAVRGILDFYNAYIRWRIKRSISYRNDESHFKV